MNNILVAEAAEVEVTEVEAEAAEVAEAEEVEVAEEEEEECNNCGEKINNIDKLEYNAKSFCEDCFFKLHGTCTECDEILRVSGILWHGGSAYCQSCYTDKFAICRECEDSILRDGSNSHDGDDYCDACFDELFSACESCSEIFPNDDLGRNNLCQSCGDNNRGCKYIRGYHAKKNRLQFDPPYDNSNPTTYVGFELEIEVKNLETKEELSTGIDDIFRQHCFMEEDGSLDCGFEIITYPISYERHLTIDWSRLMALCVHHKAKGHDTRTAGLHINLSANQFSVAEQVKIALFIFSNHNRRNIELFARRAFGAYCASKNIKKGGVKQLVDKSEKHDAVSFASDGRIEFRMFRSTLKYETLMASIQFCLMLGKFVKTHSAIACAGQNAWRKFVNLIDEKEGNEELKAYLKDRNLN